MSLRRLKQKGKGDDENRMNQHKMFVYVRPQYLLKCICLKTEFGKAIT